MSEQRTAWDVAHAILAGEVEDPIALEGLATAYILAYRTRRDEYVRDAMNGLLASPGEIAAEDIGRMSVAIADITIMEADRGV